nr:hypothetical protein [Nostoc sp. EkiNYC01]
MSLKTGLFCQNFLYIYTYLHRSKERSLRRCDRLLTQAIAPPQL